MISRTVMVTVTTRPTVAEMAKDASPGQGRSERNEIEKATVDRRLQQR